MHTLLGPEKFRRGMDLYIGRNDNHAATIRDFVTAMEDAGEIDLSEFARWYHQAGTPEITVEDRYDAAARSYELSISQLVPATPGQPQKEPMPVPLAIGLLGPNGDDLPLRLDGEDATHAGTRLLVNDKQNQVFRFADVAAPPVPSVLRNFSAPVKLQGVPLARLKFLAIHDSDPVARWDAGQQVATWVLLDLVAADQQGAALPRLDPDLVAAMRQTLADADRDPAFAAEALVLPSEATLADAMSVVAVDAIHRVREQARREVALALAAPLADAYTQFSDPGAYRIDGRSIGRRAFRNVCLAYLAAGDPSVGARMAKAQFDLAANMTDVLAALAVLVDIDGEERRAALEAYYRRWESDPLVIDKWFALQARSVLPGTTEAVRRLTTHPAFTRANPNRVRSLVGTFSQANPLHFHALSGEGYAFLADEVLDIDRANPTTAARLVQPLGQWRRYDAKRQELMRAELRRVVGSPGLSPNTFEMVTKSLD
jgi:aminopeptidase N